MLGAHREPHLPQAVVEQPLDHVPLREHLRLGRDLVRLDLPPVVDLGVQRLALGVVVELVDPPQRRVVRPRRLQLGRVQRLDHRPQRRRRHREQPCQPHVPEQARQVVGQLVEHQPEQVRVAFRLVAAQRRREVAQLLVRLALPPARHHRRRIEPQRLDVPQEHQPVEQRRRRLLLRLPQEPNPQRRRVDLRRLALLALRLVAPVHLGAHLLVEPALQPLPPHVLRLRQRRLVERHRQPVRRLRRLPQVHQQALPQPADALAQGFLRLGRQRRARHRVVGPSATRASPACPRR